jgi:hypothetical protein
VPTAFHIIATALLTGAFALAVFFLLVRGVAARSGTPWQRDMAPYADFGLLVSAAVGFLIALGGLVTGVGLWPMEAVLNSPLLKNKLTTVTMLVLIWGMFLFLRMTRGPDLWNRPVLASFASVLVIGGFFMNVLANSIGGDVAGNASGFEEIVRLFGIETRHTFYLPTWLVAVVFALGALCAAAGLAVQPFRGGARPALARGKASGTDPVV